MLCASTVCGGKILAGFVSCCLLNINSSLQQTLVTHHTFTTIWSSLFILIETNSSYSFYNHMLDRLVRFLTSL